MSAWYLYLYEAPLDLRQRRGGVVLVVEDDLRIDDQPVLAACQGLHEVEVDLATADVGAVVRAGDVEYVLVCGSKGCMRSPNEGDRNRNHDRSAVLDDLVA